jgi:NAD(P)-dependent dehydrogenase (short-subunit alcohol dehydrogenase family)
VRARLLADGDAVIGIDLKDAEVEVDLSTRHGRREAVRVVEKLASGGVDRLVLCAGVATSTLPRAILPSVNYFGAVELLDGLLPALQRGSDPAVVLMGSNSATIAPIGDTPYVQALLAHDEDEARRLADAEGHGFIPYAGAKLALSIAARRRATDWAAAGVRLNVVAPGPIETPLYARDRADPIVGKGIESLKIPLGRNGRPEEVAALVRYLLGPDAGYIHGSVFFIDGGIDASIRPDRF